MVVSLKLRIPLVSMKSNWPPSQSNIIGFNVFHRDFSQSNTLGLSTSSFRFMTPSKSELLFVLIFKSNWDYFSEFYVHEYKADILILFKCNISF